jgi:hypothetical protein
MEKIEMADEIQRNQNHTELTYSRFQVRDCVKGSNSIKRQNEIYLPMPSGMMNMQTPTSVAQANSTQGSRSMSMTQMPWYHENPAYRAYLHRARFPDITGAIMRGLTGIITKVRPEFKLTPPVQSLEDDATICNKSLVEMYGYAIGEVMQVGKICYVLDVTSKNEFKIALYSAERHVDWAYEIIDGEKRLTRSVFIETFDSDADDEVAIEYKIINSIAVYQRYKAGMPFGDEEIIIHRGKTLSRLPIFFSGATNNEADVDIIPLVGVSDISLTIYRKDADLSQAQYMTCNPTLFIYGVSEDSAPQMIGSTVTVCISNPNAKAEYPATDTSALDHVKGAIEGLYDEAIGMGAQVLGVGKKSAESAEALSIREASSGATLITIVDLVSKSISDILTFASEWAGSGEVEFDGSIDFADYNLSAQQLTALVSSWVQGAISHDTVLDKLRDANIVDSEVTNEEEKDKIKVEEEDRFTPPPVEEETVEVE